MKEFQPHELRVIEELKELKIKHSALVKFVSNPEYSQYDRLSKNEQSLLIQQESIMNEYIKVLATRVGLFF